ncbi:Neurl4 [Symbiodinium natans]|uniref:Neurl4 protein n=1 Tax=Symbiodinium natans TaxID=878477 RepID=A0A812IG16_9DINO|nr:Neurl4 [Symbiodinium natans]
MAGRTMMVAGSLKLARQDRMPGVLKAARSAPPGLLAAVAALSPGLRETEACLRSIEEEKEDMASTGLLADGTSAAASVEAQWQTASAGRWLQLVPHQSSLPPRPRPSPPPRKQPDVPDGFRSAGPGEQLWISEDGRQARHLDDTGEEMHGVLIGTRPLVLGRAGVYFEVALEEVRPGESLDGLTVGVTTTHPEDVTNVPATAEHISETWSVGYDGQMWDCKSASLTQVGWDPRSLMEGDIIGVLVTAKEGELIVFRNGTAVCAGPRSIPRDVELYAVVDLLGAARAVRWVCDASPPGQ